nr:tetratricopeptide repeat protein [uncultured Carboxylicivirga sp.]
MKAILTHIIILLLFTSCIGKETKTNDYKVVNHNFPELITNSAAKENYYKGIEKIENGDYKKAHKFLKEASKNEPNNKRILNALGNVEHELGNNDLSIECYEKALKVDSNYFETYLNYGVLLNETNQSLKAKRLLTKAIKLDINDSSAKGVLCFNLAISHYNLQECDEAISLAQKAKEEFSRKDFVKTVNEFIKHVEHNCQNKIVVKKQATNRAL